MIHGALHPEYLPEAWALQRNNHLGWTLRTYRQFEAPNGALWREEPLWYNDSLHADVINCETRRPRGIG